MNTTRVFSAAALAATALAFGLSAQAASLTCPEPDPGRTVTVTYDESEGTMACGPYGQTNVQPSGQYWSSIGYFEVEKLEADSGDLVGSFFTITGFGGTSGTWEITDPSVLDVPDLHIVFKFGNPNTPPDWVSFQVNGVTSGTWASSHRWGLSHVALVPEPATIALFGAGLLGLGLVRRRRKI